MRLFAHNMLACQAKTCVSSGKNYPLKLTVTQSEEFDKEYQPEVLKHLLSKIDWNVLVTTVKENNLGDLPDNYNENDLENEEFMLAVHKLILNTGILEGSLLCENCSKEYKIADGIAHMLLDETNVE